MAAYTLDTQGRPVASQFGGLAATTMTYDRLGRLATMVSGSGAEQRTTSFTYNAAGYLATIIDPLGRTQAFAYDGAGRRHHADTPGRPPAGARLRRQRKRDQRDTALAVRPTVYGYSPINQLVNINPPDVAGVPADVLTISYDLDHEVTSVNRADGKVLTYGYDAAGRLNAMGMTRGSVNLVYSPTTGHVDSATAPGPIVTTFAHDGPLVTAEWIAGPFGATLAWTYDASFRAVTQRIEWRQQRELRLRRR